MYWPRFWVGLGFGSASAGFCLDFGFHLLGIWLDFGLIPVWISAGSGLISPGFIALRALTALEEVPGGPRCMHRFVTFRSFLQLPDFLQLFSASWSSSSGFEATSGQVLDWVESHVHS